MGSRLLKQRTAVARNDFTHGESTSSRAEIEGEARDIFWSADSPTWVHATYGIPVGVIHVAAAANAG
jgi:hypothetical protein